MDTGDILEVDESERSDEDPLERNDDWEDDFADLYGDPGEILDLDALDLS